MVIGDEVLRLPEESVATAVTVCAPDGKLPVSHCTVPAQLVVPVQDTVPKSEPSPKNWSVLTFTLSEAAAEIMMLFPVHTPFGGDVMATVGNVVSAVEAANVVVDVDGDVIRVDGEASADEVPAPDA